MTAHKLRWNQSIIADRNGVIEKITVMLNARFFFYKMGFNINANRM
jgi:hypothetical protein